MVPCRFESLREIGEPILRCTRLRRIELGQEQDSQVSPTRSSCRTAYRARPRASHRVLQATTRMLTIFSENHMTRLCGQRDSNASTIFSTA